MPENKYHSRSKFYFNIVVPSALAVLLFVLTLFSIVIPAFENAMMDRKRETIKELTKAAYSILAKYHKEEIDSVLSRGDAQETAISRIQYLRYGEENKDYFWITDMTPVMIMHPYRPELNGQDLRNFEDSHGKKLFVESVTIAKNEGSGYVDYMWQWKDDSVHIVPKLSYVQLFEPWNWIIGTGIYIEDVKAEIELMSNKFFRISVIISLLVAIILFYVGRQSLKIERKRMIAEGELHESREKYKSLVDASTEGFMILMDNKISFTNSVLQRITGLSHEEIAEKNIDEILKLPFNPYTLSNEHIKPIETQLFDKDSKAITVLVSVSQAEFSEKEAVIISIKDLSQDEELHEELIHNREKFKTLMDKLNLGVFRTTLDHRGRFLEVNETALKILGYKHIDELSGTYILSLFDEPDDKRSFRTQLLQKGFIKNQVLKLRRRNGQFCVVSVSLVVISENNTPRFCDGIIEEVSPQHHDAHTEKLLLEYTAFSSLLQQDVGSFVQDAVYCRYDAGIKEIKRILTEMNAAVVLVKKDENQLLGFIGPKELCSSSEPESQETAYQVMHAPILYTSSNETLADSLHLLSKSNVSHLVVRDTKGDVCGTFSYNSLQELLSHFPGLAHIKAQKSFHPAQLVALRKSYINALLPSIEHSGNPRLIFQRLSLISDEITQRIIEICINESGPPPVEFCFMSLGSDARREQSLYTDQDNALIYDDSGTDSEDVASYFLSLSEKICGMLNDTGYNYCKGNIMAQNPEWCRPLSEWKSYFRKWINTGTGKDLLDINIFFDLRAVYGQTEMVNTLQNHIFELTINNPAYLFHLAQNTLILKPQVGFWGNIQLETAGAPPETVHIKDSIMPIVNFARIYALKNQIAVSGTQERLEILRNRNILKNDTFINISQSFDYLNLMRLKHQASLLKNNLKPDNLINTKNLSELDTAIVKKVISNINGMLSKLSFDFKGSL